MRAVRSLRGITVGLAGLLQACVRSERPADFPRLPDGVPLAAWYEAEPVASEDYVAMVGETDFGHTQPRIRVERGAYRCGASDTRRPHGAVDAAIATCPPDMQTELERVQAPALVIFKSGGSRVVSVLTQPRRGPRHPRAGSGAARGRGSRRVAEVRARRCAPADRRGLSARDSRRPAESEPL